MTKKMIFRMSLFLGFVFVIVQTNTYSQTLSKEEQKLMQNQIKDSLNNVHYLARQAKLDSLLVIPPAECGLTSIDGLATNSKTLIEEQQKINNLLKTYVGQLTSDEAGQTGQQSGKKVSAEDIQQLITSVANQILAVTDATTKVTAASGDVAKLNPMKAGAGKKSIGYTKAALSGLGTQLKTQANILNQMKIYQQAINNQ